MQLHYLQNNLPSFKSLASAVERHIFLHNLEKISKMFWKIKIIPLFLGRLNNYDTIYGFELLLSFLRAKKQVGWVFTLFSW